VFWICAVVAMLLVPLALLMLRVVGQRPAVQMSE
jgi:hypothetical protein